MRIAIIRGAVAVAAALLLSAGPVLAQQGDVMAGRRVAAGLCQACHGMDGLSKQVNAPNVGGQPEMYLAAQLKAYRDGTRVNEQMAVVARSLGEAQVQAVVAYYAAIEVEAVKLPGR